MKKLIPLLLLFVSLPSLAQRQFDIEVIIFKRATSPEATNESWPNQIPDIEVSRAGSLTNQQYTNSKGVMRLPSSSFQLTEQVAKIKNHAGFTVLVHDAWRQGDNGKASSPVFHIRAGKDFSNTYNADGSEKGANTNLTSPISGVQEVAIDKPLYELDGTLQIYVQHYLFAEAQFDLKAPSTEEVIIDEPVISDLTSITVDNQYNGAPLVDTTVVAGNLQAIEPKTEIFRFLKSYRLDQKRRMRSGETYYFDHPLMGMIIQVRRVDN